MGKLRAVVDGLGNTLQNVVIVPFCHPESEITLQSNKDLSKMAGHNNISKSTREMFMAEFLALGKDVSDRDELHYEQLPFNQPLFIMYSSGTTGKPKCIVRKVLLITRKILHKMIIFCVLQ